MKVGVISTYYPSDENPSKYAFVHQRVKEYKKFFDVKVFSKGKENYVYGGVEVISGGILKVKNEIKKYEPDVIIIHQASPKFSSILIPFLDAPIITWIHGFEVMKSKYYNENIFETYLKLFINKRVFRHVKKFVAVSEWMKREAIKNCNIPEEKIAVIPNFVEDFFKYRIRKYDEDKFISLRNFQPKYGLNLSIPAVKNLPIKYHIIGNGTDEEYRYLKTLSENAENIKIIRKSIPHEKIPEVYNEYNCFLAPSLEEAQGLAMCEAMASGMPVIATNVGGIPEFVRDGIDGFLSPPTVEGIRSSIEKFIKLSEDEKIEMGKNASEYSRKKCNKKLLLRKEVELIREIGER